MTEHTYPCVANHLVHMNFRIENMVIFMEVVSVTDVMICGILFGIAR